MKILIKVFLSLIATGIIAYAIKLLLGEIPQIGIFAIIFFSALILSMISFIFVVKPIKKLNEVIDNISKGKLDTKIDSKLMKSDDELGDLARGFDRVLVSLKYAVNMVGISKERLKLGEMLEDKKETEKKLKITEDFLNRIIENIGIPVVAYNKKGELLLANKKFTEITGYSKEEVINMDKFVGNTLPAKMASDKFIKTVNSFNKGEDIDNFVLPVKCKNNATILVVCNLANIRDTDGNNNGEVIFMRNLNDIFGLEKEMRFWAANGFTQANEKDHSHSIEISDNRGEKSVKKSKNRNKRV